MRSWNVKDNYTIECYCHTYVTLKWNDQFVFCLDNDMMYMEEMIERIEKRTGQKFNTIKRKGSIQDFDGLRFLNGGFKKGAEIFG